jgi:hypothetical protein
MAQQQQPHTSAALEAAQREFKAVLARLEGPAQAVAFAPHGVGFRVYTETSTEPQPAAVLLDTVEDLEGSQDAVEDLEGSSQYAVEDLEGSSQDAVEDLEGSSHTVEDLMRLRATLRRDVQWLLWAAEARLADLEQPRA